MQAITIQHCHDKVSVFVNWRAISDLTSLYLWTELFRGQLERRNDLLGEDFSVRKAKREERYLGDQSVVRNHHRYRPKQRLHTGKWSTEFKKI